MEKQKQGDKGWDETTKRKKRLEEGADGSAVRAKWRELRRAGS